MNHLYRLVWNDALRAHVPAAECTRARGKACGTGPHDALPAGPASRTLRRLNLWLALAFAPAAALALPQGEQLVGGAADVRRPDAATLTIRQSTPRAILNWQSFDIAAGEKVSVVQPSADAVLLNRVLGNEYTLVEGSLRANGRIFLVNPNGILFGPQASVNVGGLVASTLDIKDGNFLNEVDRVDFEGNGSGEVRNRGLIVATGGGLVALLGGQVHNDGTIRARLGRVELAAGAAISLDLWGDGLFGLSVYRGTLDALVRNGGLIKADGGKVILRAEALDHLAQAVVNNEGVIEALQVGSAEEGTLQGGRIELTAGGERGRVEVGGTLRTRGADGVLSEQSLIELKGTEIRLKAGTVLSAGNGGLLRLAADGFEVDAATAQILSASLGGGTDVDLDALDGGGIAVKGALKWSSRAALGLTAEGRIALDAPIDGWSLYLHGGSAISSTADVNVAQFTLQQGRWQQLGDPLPRFWAADFRIGNGSFLRALGGDGSRANPYRLADIYGVQGMGSQGMLHRHYQLANHIYAEGTDTWGWDGSTYSDETGEPDAPGFVPIGNASRPFTGSLDGRGHTISGLHIRRDEPQIIYDDYGEIQETVYPAHTGLFGYLRGATISNVTLSSPKVTGVDYVGALAGTSEASTVRNSHVLAPYVSGASEVGGLIGRLADGATVSFSSTEEGFVSGASYTGGLVGYSDAGTIADSRSATNTGMSGADWVGGLVGESSGGTIVRSRASGEVTGGQMVGGLVGSLSHGGTVLDSEASGRVSGSDYVGGLAGELRNASRVDASHASGEVTGETFVGGLVGVSAEKSAIRDSHAAGAVSGLELLGGLAGANYSGASISGSHASGAVEIRWLEEGRDGVAGGLVGGNHQGTVTGSYASGAVNGGRQVGGLVGSSMGHSRVSDSYATGTVTGREWVGGLVGWNGDSTVRRSYASGRVSGRRDVGGLVGASEGGRVIASYWDVGHSGQSASAGGTGLSSAQMRQAASFRGWNLATTGGSNAVWRLYEGRGAPLLRGFLKPLALTVHDAAKTYDGQAYRGGSGVSFSGEVDPRLLLGQGRYGGSAQGAIDAGRYTLASGLYSDQHGYDLIETPGTLTISPATLQVSLDEVSARQGEAFPAWGFRVTGLAGGDTLEDAVSGRLRLSGVPDMTAAPGDHAYTVAGFVPRNGNYVLSYRSGVLHLRPALTAMLPESFHAARHEAGQADQVEARASRADDGDPLPRLLRGGLRLPAEIEDEPR